MNDGPLTLDELIVDVRIPLVFKSGEDIYLAGVVETMHGPYAEFAIQNDYRVEERFGEVELEDGKIYYITADPEGVYRLTDEGKGKFRPVELLISTAADEERIPLHAIPSWVDMSGLFNVQRATLVGIGPDPWADIDYRPPVLGDYRWIATATLLYNFAYESAFNQDPGGPLVSHMSQSDLRKFRKQKFQLSIGEGPDDPIIVSRFGEPFAMLPVARGKTGGVITGAFTAKEGTYVGEIVGEN